MAASLSWRWGSKRERVWTIPAESEQLHVSKRFFAGAAKAYIEGRTLYSLLDQYPQNLVLYEVVFRGIVAAFLRHVELPFRASYFDVTCTAQHHARPFTVCPRARLVIGRRA